MIVNTLVKLAAREAIVYNKNPRVKEGRKEGGKKGRKEGRKEGGKEGRREGRKEVTVLGVTDSFLCRAFSNVSV